MNTAAKPAPARRSLWIATALIATLAAGASGRGISDIPLVSHEIYVAQTAQNMLDSGDWLVPRLNGEYRLTKPPLSYWIVAGAAAIAADSQVSPALARLPSVLAAVGVALLALWMGARLFDRPTGILAGLMCAACVATFKYGHNARPDMLYAFWTTAVLACWIGSRPAHRVRQRAWIWALWGLFGLATLTKGPQAPLILMAALVAHALLTGTPAPALVRRLRPLRGVLIVIAMVAPWYLLLRQTVGAEALGHSQLSGGLLTINPLRVFDPYYLVHAPLLWLPWVLLAPAAGLLVWRDPRGPAGRLAFIVVFAALAFALGPQYRQVYMLPWLGPAMILFAATVTGVAWARIVVMAIVVLVAGSLGWLVFAAGASAAATALAGSILLAAAIPALRAGRSSAAAALACTALALGLFQGGTVPALWSPSRYAERAFAQSLARQVVAHTPVFVWDLNPATYAYHLGRPVAGSESLDDVCRWIDEQHASSVLIYPRARQRELSRLLSVPAAQTGNDFAFVAMRLPANTACNTAGTSPDQKKPRQ